MIFNRNKEKQNDLSQLQKMPTLKLSRLEGLSDCVFSIAMTILVFGLTIPAKNLVKTDSDLFHALEHMWPKFLVYFLSFLILGMFWIRHHGQIALIKYVDRKMLWINILFLMFIALIPFSTQLSGEFDHLGFASSVCWANLIIIDFFLIINWGYAKKQNFIPLIIEKPEIYKAIQLKLVGIEVFFVLAFAASFIHIRAGFLVFFSVIGYYGVKAIISKTNKNPFTG